MNWQIVLLSWALIHAPIALCIGRAFKKSSFADGSKHPIGETDATNAVPPASSGLVASDNFARLA